MVKVIGVRFRTAGKIYYFDPLNFQVKRGDHVIVETARGVEYGTVVGSPREVEDDKVVQPLKPVLRVATERDDEQEAGNKAKEKEAFKICQEKIRKHGLEMKLIDAEYTFDNNKVLFYFTAVGSFGWGDGEWMRSWEKTLQVFLKRESSCARSACATRRRFWAESASAAECFAVTAICPSLFRFPSRWRRSRTFP